MSICGCSVSIKKIISIILGLFVVASIVYWVVTESTNSSLFSTDNKETQSPPTVASNSATSTTTEELKQNKAVIKKEKVVKGLYFHGTNRCYTCNLMEGYIRDVIRESFDKEVKEGKLTFESINIEEPNKNHYIEDYQLQSISFFLSLHKKGKEVKFENIERIWRLAGNESMFKSYIKTEIKKFLEM